MGHLNLSSWAALFILLHLLVMTLQTLSNENNMEHRQRVCYFVSQHSKSFSVFTKGATKWLVTSKSWLIKKETNPQGEDLSLSSKQVITKCLRATKWHWLLWDSHPSIIVPVLYLNRVVVVCSAHIGQRQEVHAGQVSGPLQNLQTYTERPQVQVLIWTIRQSCLREGWTWPEL